MADILFIQDLRIDCIIGRAEWERMVRQTVRLDLWLECDIRKAADQDDVSDDTVNTKALSKRLMAWIAETQFKLIETLAERTCELILGEFPVRSVKLRLSKPGALRGARNVGVIITRPNPGDPP